MKRNAFGEAYCATVDEARDEIDRMGRLVDDCYLGDVAPPEPPRFGATAEVIDRVDGETICHLEAKDEVAVQALAAAIGLSP